MTGILGWLRVKFCWPSWPRIELGEVSTQPNRMADHTLPDSVSVVRTIFKVCAKRQNLTLSQPKIPEPIVTEFKRRDYVGDIDHQKNLGLIRSGVFAPHVSEIYTPPVRNLTVGAFN